MKADLWRTVYRHKWWSPVSCRSSARQGKFAGQRPTTVPRNHLPRTRNKQKASLSSNVLTACNIRQRCSTFDHCIRACTILLSFGDDWCIIFWLAVVK